MARTKLNLRLEQLGRKVLMEIVSELYRSAPPTPGDNPRSRSASMSPRQSLSPPPSNPESSDLEPGNAANGQGEEYIGELPSEVADHLFRGKGLLWVPQQDANGSVPESEKLPELDQELDPRVEDYLVDAPAAVQPPAAAVTFAALMRAQGDYDSSEEEDPSEEEPRGKRRKCTPYPADAYIIKEEETDEEDDASSSDSAEEPPAEDNVDRNEALKLTLIATLHQVIESL